MQPLLGLGRSGGGAGPGMRSLIKGGARQGVRAARGDGVESLHQSGGFPQPSPSGPGLPVASAQQLWLALNLLGIRWQAPSGGPAGGGPSPTRVPGRDLASRERSLQGASALCLALGRVFMRIISFGSQQSQEIRIGFLISGLQIRKLRRRKGKSVGLERDAGFGAARNRRPPPI